MDISILKNINDLLQVLVGLFNCAGGRGVLKNKNNLLKVQVGLLNCAYKRHSISLCHVDNKEISIPSNGIVFSELSVSTRSKKYLKTKLSE